MIPRIRRPHHAVIRAPFVPPMKTVAPPFAITNRPATKPWPKQESVDGPWPKREAFVFAWPVVKNVVLITIVAPTNAETFRAKATSRGLGGGESW